MELHELAVHDLVSTADARTLGLGPSDLRRLVRAGTVRRVIRGWYAVRPPGAGPAPWEGDDVFEAHRRRHRLLTVALVRSFDGRVAASHQSALVLLGGRLWRSPLDVAHLARSGDDHSRHRAMAVIHPLASPTVLAAPGVPTVHPAHAVVQVGLRSRGTGRPAMPFESLVAADGALHDGLVSPDELVAAVAVHAGHPGIPGVRELLRWADGRHESVGETRLAQAMRALGYRFRAQVEYAVDGRLWRVDFELEDEPVLIEFDGMGKYLAGLAAPTPQQLQRALAAEKWREDALRSLGKQMARVTWADLDVLGVIRDKIEAARSLARLRRTA